MSLKRGDRIVLVQSGAQFPDGPVLEELKPYYSVIPLSGVPVRHDRYRRREDEATKQPIDKSLRLAAAKSGARTLIVYWGILETGREDHGTKTISWVPVIGRIIPDEKQKMRIRLKAAVIDVASGAWEFVIPEMYNDACTSARVNREESDQNQVTLLKAKAYKALVSDLLERFNYRVESILPLDIVQRLRERKTELITLKTTGQLSSGSFNLFGLKSILS